MHSRRKKVFSFINQCIDYISILVFILIFVVVLIQICLRYIFNSPLIWSEELARYAFIWICYLGWTLGTRNKSHIQITLFLNLLPKLLKKIITTLNSLLLIAFSLYMMIYGFKMAQGSMRLPAITIPITLGVVYLIVPVSAAIIILYESIYIKDFIWGEENKSI